MFKKIISSLLVGSTLIIGTHDTTEDINNVDLQKAINHNPIIQQEFKATGQYQVTNIKDNTDTLPISDIEESPKRLELGKTYTVSFKNDYPIKIEKVK